MIAIIDYGLSNLKSVLGAVEKLHFEVIVTDNVIDIESADKLILPGVGAFADGINNLKKKNLIEPLTKIVIKDQKPILGICLGAQLMCKEGFEFGHTKGLNWIDASVVKITSDDNLKLPHVGWNNLFKVRESKLLDGIPDQSLFYFVHSYRIKCNQEKNVTGVCEYGDRFTASIQVNNIYATQFHPEKSQLNGLNVLRNFLEKC